MINGLKFHFPGIGPLHLTDNIFEAASPLEKIEMRLVNVWDVEDLLIWNCCPAHIMQGCFPHDGCSHRSNGASPKDDLVPTSNKLRTHVGFTGPWSASHTSEFLGRWQFHKLSLQKIVDSHWIQVSVIWYIVIALLFIIGKNFDFSLEWYWIWLINCEKWLAS